MQHIVISFNYQNENARKKLVLVLVLVKLKQQCCVDPSPIAGGERGGEVKGGRGEGGEERRGEGELYQDILTRASKTRSPTVSAFFAIMSNKALNVSARN